jgi:hypothetical protein
MEPRITGYYHPATAYIGISLVSDKQISGTAAMVSSGASGKRRRPSCRCRVLTKKLKFHIIKKLF